MECRIIGPGLVRTSPRSLEGKWYNELTIVAFSITFSGRLTVVAMQSELATNNTECQQLDVIVARPFTIWLDKGYFLRKDLQDTVDQIDRLEEPHFLLSRLI
jgi:hypothetical protein